MDDENHPPHVARIFQRLDELGLSGNAASLAAFGNASGIKNMTSGRSKSPGIDQFEKLARVLKTSAAWLAYGDGDGTEAANSNAWLPVTGESSAGQWLEVEQIDHARFGEQPIPPDPRWPSEAQFVLLVRGTSINELADDGDYLSCVEARVVRREPRDGDLVIIERTRDAGQLIQRTAKVYKSNGPVREFHPKSKDPSHKPIILDPSVPAGEGEKVEVRGFVTWAHKRIESPTLA